MNRNTVNRFYLVLRQITAEEIKKAAPLPKEVELDESYFGGRSRGKRGWATTRMASAFGLLKRRVSLPSLLFAMLITSSSTLPLQRQGEDADADHQVPGGA